MNNKIVFFCIDMSGSMDKEKHEEAVRIIKDYKDKGYFIKDIIGFTTTAKKIKLNDYINSKVNSGGGTYISSGLSMAFNDIVENYNFVDQDITVVIISDGDNWSEDIPRVKALVIAMKALGIKIKFHDVIMKEESYSTRMSEHLIRSGIITSQEVEVIREPKTVKKRYTADIDIEGSITTVRLLSNGAVIGVGTAKCNPDDEYNEAFGVKVAMCRALKLDPFEEENKKLTVDEIHKGLNELEPFESLELFAKLMVTLNE